MRTFTFATRQEIGALMKEHEVNRGARVPHHALASAVTDWIRPRTSKELRGALQDVISSTEGTDLVHAIEQLIGTTEERQFTWDRSNPPRSEDLFIAAGLATSKGDARRLLAGKGLYLNRKVPEAGAAVAATEVLSTGAGKFVLLQKGKKTYQPLRIIGLD